MRYFALREAPQRQAAQIDACHRWFVPGVICDICGRTWSTSGVAYPTIEIPEDLAAVIPRRPIPRREFSRLVPELRQRVGSSVPVPPGTEFGPLVGTMSGVAASIQWVNPWTLLLSAAARSSVAAAGIHLRTVPAALKTAHRHDALHEIEIRPNGYLHAPEYWKPQGLPCASCGYERFERPESLVLKARTLDNGCHIFRIADLPTIIVASERFVAALASEAIETEDVTVV